MVKKHVSFSSQKTERPVLDRPLKVGGGIQPRLVTVLTPATTFTVGEDFNQKGRAVNSTPIVIYNFYVKVCRARVSREMTGGADGTRTRDLRRDRPAF